jgi:hypothetical protein
MGNTIIAKGTVAVIAPERNRDLVYDAVLGHLTQRHPCETAVIR